MILGVMIAPLFADERVRHRRAGQPAINSGGHFTNHV
jgi:hypothetical protein